MVGYLGRRILPEVGVRARMCGEGLCVSYAGLHGIVKFTGVMEEVDRIRGFSHHWPVAGDTNSSSSFTH
jgi:hypothetical protein